MPAIPKSGLCFPPVPSSKTCTPVEHHIFSFLSLWWGFSNKRVAKFVANLLLLGFGCCHGSYLGAVSPDTTSSFCREGGEHYSFLSPPGGKKSQGTTELHHPELSWPDLPGNFSYWKAEVPRPLVCPCTYPRLRVGNGVGRMAPAQHNAVRGPPPYHPGYGRAWSTSRSESIWHWQRPQNCWVGSDPTCCIVWNEIEYLGGAQSEEGKIKWVFM